MVLVIGIQILPLSLRPCPELAYYRRKPVLRL